MSVGLALIGALVVAVAIVDTVWTTLAAAGGGPLSRRIGRWVWLAVGRRPVAGPLVLVATAALWTGLLWLGWALVFLASDPAVVAASSGAPAGVWDRVYFAGYTVITLGLGDFVPSTPGWQAATVVSAATGLIFITLGVSYYTSVLKAVVDKRRLASLAGALGERPAAIVANAWDGDGWTGLGSVLTTLADHLATLDRHHQAYPVVHFFGQAEAERATAVQVARLADALVLFESAVETGAPPAPLRAAQGALAGLVRTLSDFSTPADTAPPSPYLGPLLAAGVPLADHALAAFDRPDIVRQRRALLGFVQGERFDWSDVSPTTP